MHGLVNRSIERFVRDTYGREVWIETIRELDLGFTEFEAMMLYEPEVTERLLAAVAASLGRGHDDLLEDIGTYLISNPQSGALRRLLRFSGVDFVDFLHSLEDLPERARLAVADLDLPPLDLEDLGAGRYCLRIGLTGRPQLCLGPVMMGILRAMADDYGALVLMAYQGARDGHEWIEIHLLEEAFADGRAFDLSIGGVRE
ncbi:MAG: heme NO-binding protein [Rhodobacteraceae bacterium CG17_big_fil_post_rev_8_21_14_2_50_63_15]|nr:heme NO-binding protein [Roseovarius sp.]PIV78007.1 MAG: heme NO-binding protein [Rhodobacteraceae bacterium CG17_big_fil_post_rev_8_21_14_2_50_63_15]